MTCPGSVVLSKDIPNTTSEFAKEGTVAHALAEKMLTFDAFSPPGDITQNEGLYSGDLEMYRHVSVYVEHVESLCNGRENTLYVEEQVKVNDNVWGTADAIVWDSETKTLYVIDLKYGAGIAVEVENNTQLKIYALAALLTMGYSAKKVNVGIVQPRCFHPHGAIRAVEFDAVDLIDFNAELEEAVQRVKAAEAAPLSEIMQHLNPTEKGCRWCPANRVVLGKIGCPAVAKKSQELAKIAFAHGIAYDPKQLADALNFLPIIEGWIKNTREFAYNEAEKGNAIPTYKLVNKRAIRKWRDEAEAEKALLDVIDSEQLVKVERKLVSPAEAEKLLDKAQREILKPLVIAESSGHTLVHESDKREAIRVDAKAAFS
jgi:hypothetical protein